MEIQEINKVNIKTSVGGAFSYAWQIVKEKFISLFLVFLIMAVVGMPMSSMKGAENFSFIHAIFIIFGIGYSIFILNPMSYGVAWINLKAVRKLDFDVKETFDAFTNYLNVVLAALLKSVIVGFGIAFFIIPGIVFACRLAFVPYLVMDKKLDPVKAVEESWRLTQGYGWRLFGMGLLSILVFIGGLLVFIFGVVVSIIWIRAAYAAIYEAVLQEQENKSINQEIIDEK